MAAFHYNPKTNYKADKAVVIGAMDKRCQHCDALKYAHETPGMCCTGGKVKLPLFNAPPPELITLLEGKEQRSKNFLGKIRRYNSAFQMTSFGVTKEIAGPEVGFMPTFKVQGQIYHRIGSLFPPSDADKKAFLQIYFMGEEEQEIERRAELFEDLDKEIIAELQRCLHR